MNTKTAFNNSYTKSKQLSKKWVYFNWFIFGLILMAGLGYATTVADTGITLSPQLNGIYYVTNNGTDMILQINSLINSGVKKVSVQPGTITSSNTILLNSQNTELDMSGTIFQYSGSNSAVILNTTRLNFEFFRITTTAPANNAIRVDTCSYCIINGNYILSSDSLNSMILINNTVSTGGNNIWNIGTLDSRYNSTYGIYIPDTSISYEGDTFNIGMMLQINNTFIKIGDTGTADKEHYEFNVGFDALPNNATSFIETWNDKSSFYIKSTTDTMTDFDIILKSTASNNAIFSSRSDLNVSDQGTNNAILSPNVRLQQLQVNTNQTISGVDNQVIRFGNLNNVLTILQIVPGSTATRSMVELKNSNTGNVGGSRFDLNGDTLTISSITAGSGTPVRTIAITNYNLTTLGANYTRFTANTSGLICNSGTAGSIYYDNSLFKHLGCNSTTWNALY